MIFVRLMTPADIEAVAALSTQLGYASTSEQILKRILEICKREHEHCVGLAIDEATNAVGFLHVRINYDLVSDASVEIASLVVDESRRGSGVGRALMLWAENWAQTKGFKFVSLKTRTTRADAHKFYEKLSYKNIKASYTYKKEFEGQVE